MRSPRLPGTAPASLPISFSHRYHPKTQRVELVIDAPEEWSAALMDGLALLSHFTQQAKRHLEAGYRDLRTDATLTALDADYSIIRDAYKALRLQGLKHRAAVHALVSDASLPFHGRWSFSEFNWCIQSAPSSTPKLKVVPASGEGSR